MTRAAAISLSHGGGPMPVLGDPGHKDIVRSLKERVPKILRLGTSEAPKAIVLVTAHWSTRNPTISSGAKHSLYYDYGGFPSEAYKLKYNAPGSPEVAKQVSEAIKAEGLKPEMDDSRGWDHGVFVPMMIINPEANIPIVQVSVLSSESPSDHLAMGRALSKLRDQNVAIIGSGFASFHNLRLMFSGLVYESSFHTRYDAWNKAVTSTIAKDDLESRGKGLQDWREWPGAFEMHPRGGAEHFLPLVVVAGAGGDAKAEYYSDEFMGMKVWSYYWKD